MKRAIFSAFVGALGIIGFQANAQDARTFTDPNGFQARETAGGYESVNPPVPVGTPASLHLASKASISPSVAFPAPAPAKSYPPCTARRQDGCQQRR